MDHYHGESNGKEIRFQDPTSSSSMQSRHSIATSHVPLLAPVSSASQIPKQAFRMTNPTQEVDMSAYFEQCRNVNEQLRKTHEQERKAWEIERAALRTRIADLEFRLNKAGGGSRRRLSNESSHTSGRSFRPDFQVPFITGAMNGNRSHGHTISNAPLEHLKHEDGRPVWEPESPAPATRVFSHDEDVHHLPSISEDGPLEDLSPQCSRENKPIPIQEIDETLDGITVKSEGVKSSFTKVMSPIIITSPARSPSPSKHLLEPTALKLDASALLDPLDAKLKKHAGHTPLAFDEILSSTASTGDPTPREEKPIAPAPSTRPPLRPSERSDSYFSTTNIPTTDIREEAIEETDGPEPQFVPEEDKPLTGPLMLDPSGKSEASHNFLEQLDHKLNDEVRKSLSSSPALAPTTSAESNKTDDDNMPRLRLKKSTNFGSAYGAKAPWSWNR